MFTIVLLWLWLCYSIQASPIGKDSTSKSSWPVTTTLSSYSKFQITFGIITGFIILISLLIVICKCLCAFYTDSSSSEPSKYQSIHNSNSNYITNTCEDLKIKSAYRDRERYNEPSGLMNSSETCYMNSMIQAIASSKLLIQDYNELQSKCDSASECSMLKILIKLLKDINNPSDRVRCSQTNTATLKELMKRANWVKESQQDSFQLLSAVINAIQKDIKDILVEEEITMPPKLNMLHSFTESNLFNKVQHHLAIALPLCGNFRQKPGVELNFLMDAFFMPSAIEDRSNETQMFLFKKAPNTLILHIQANEWDVTRAEYIKPTYYIIYTETMKYTFNIHMNIDTSDMQRKEVVYGLVAVVHHTGGVTGGHYIAYRKHCDQWYLTNDEQVERASLPQNLVPYIMVYDKISET